MSWRWAIVLLAVLASSTPAAAKEVPIGQQAMLLLKVLAYDRNLEARSTSDVVTVMVVSRPGYNDSMVIGQDMTLALSDLAKSVQVAGSPLRVVSLKLTEQAPLQEQIRAADPSAIYICPGLSSMLPEIVDAARTEQVLTVSHDVDYVDQGVGVSFRSKIDRVSVVVNVEATVATGVSLEAALLRLAETR